MKTTHLLLAAAIAAVATMTSCNKEESSANDRVAVRFTSASALPDMAQVATRAAGNTWALNDPVGVFMVEHGTTIVYADAWNRLYKAAAAGASVAFTADAANTIYYPMDAADKVDFIAYYPYVAAYGGFEPYQVNLATQTDPAAIDLLWARADNAGAGYDKTHTGGVELAFAHKLSRLTIGCTAHASVGVPLTAMAVTVKGMKTTGTFDLAGGPVVPTGSATDFAPRTVTDGAAYDAIIMPTVPVAPYAAGTVTVEFKLANTEVFTWNVSPSAALAFEPGKEYAYDVTLTRTGITVTGTVHDWEPGTGGTGTAE